MKKVTPENLAGLGASRLAEILADVAQARPELKRRLRMELAAEQGPQHLLAEIDKRLGSLQASQGKIGWRQRPVFIRDFDSLRGLIAERLAALDAAAAVERLWLFMEVAQPLSRRFKDKDGTLAAIFGRAAEDLGRLIAGFDPYVTANTLVDALVLQPSAWTDWLPGLLSQVPPQLAQRTLAVASERRGVVPGWLTNVRHLADAAGDIDAFRATYSDDALKTPALAADIGRRLLAADRIGEARDVLSGAVPKPKGWQNHSAPPDYVWESVWIDYLERAGEADAAQAARWASFERTLSVERAKAYTSGLDDFDDVEAEARAFAHAARHPDFERGLRFLMAWPALPEAGRMIMARPDDVSAQADDAEAWAAKLRLRYPAAAHLLLRKAAAAALRRRDFKTCERLTQEADAITP